MIVNSYVIKRKKRHRVRPQRTNRPNNLKRRYIEKTLKFTEKVIVCLTILFICNWFVSVGLIILAIKETSNFAYLDTLITETSTTFRDIVGVAVIKFGVENIFKYNDFGGRIQNNGTYIEDTTDEDEGGIQG